MQLEKTNKATKFNNKEKIQDDQYSFPYHYMDLYSEFHRRIRYLDYLSVLRIAQEMLAPLNGQRLLDAGCGDGRFCYELSQNDIEIVGVDHSERAISFAKAFNPKIEFHVSDLSKLSFEEEFDIAILMEVLEHIPPDNIPIAISELWQALKTKGRLLVSVPTTNLPPSEKHYRHFTIESLENLFTPMFQITKIVGHLRTGKTWKRFLRLQKYAELAWPMRNKVPGINKFLKYIENYHRTNVETSSVEQAGRLLLLLRKNSDI